MSVTIRTPNLNKWQKTLKTKVDDALMGSSEILRGDIVKAWLSGKAPDKTALKKGNKNYLNHKKSKGRKSKIDFNLSGDMQQAFTVKKLTRTMVQLFFNSSLERKKAQGNYNKRRNMLRIGTALHEKLEIGRAHV